MDGKKEECLVTETSHNCSFLKVPGQVSLIYFCLLSLIDMITDIVTTIGMFKDEKYILGALSVIAIVSAGVVSSWKLRPLNKNKKCDFSKLEIFFAITFTLPVYYAYKMFISHPEKKYDRSSCTKLKFVRCRIKDSEGDEVCRNYMHKRRIFSKAANYQRMIETQSQLFLQLINIAPDYLNASLMEKDFWFYWRLISLLITFESLSRSCTDYNHEVFEGSLKRFSLTSIGRGWAKLRPQKWLLFVIHGTSLATRVFTVMFIMILPNHDFGMDNYDSWSDCHPGTVWEVILTRTQSTCYFENKVGWLVAFYILIFLGLIVLPFVISIIVIAKREKKYAFKSLKKYIFLFILQNTFAIMPFLNYREWPIIRFAIRMVPFFVQSIILLALASFIIRDENSFTNVDLGIYLPSLAWIAIGIGISNLVCLLLWEYKWSPTHYKSISAEKTLAVLMANEKIPKDIDVTCSNSGKEILREAIRKSENGKFFYKKEVESMIIEKAAKKEVTNQKKGNNL